MIRACIYSCLLIAAVSISINKTEWTPPACDELAEGVPCRQLYKHPQGSQFVGACPTETMSRPDGCGAQFKGKADEDKCPQIACPKALGVTFKLICGGGCCPTCWAPDHVVAMDRHTSLENPATVPPAPQAPPTCATARCFEPLCGEGFTKGMFREVCVVRASPAAHL